MRRTLKYVLLSLVVLLPAALATLPVRAQDQRERVARVSISQGETSYQRGDDQDWNALGPNTPLMTGDSLYAAQDGRAEIELGDGNAVRLDNSTALDIVNLSGDVTQLGLSEGYVNVSVRDIPAHRTLEMDTPLAAATFWEPGTYRIGLDGDVAHFGVVSGRLSVILNGEQLDVQEGEVLELQGGNSPSYGYSRLPAGNSFDQWSEGRDTRRQRSISSRYVNRAVIGFDDLDDHGSWRRDPTYGNVWHPARVSNDWAPYQTGRWMWQDPYGWTWVSYESWGWAPYHYGRWVYVGNSWGWIPPPPMGYRGPRAVMNIQAYYSPALVAFIGGSNWSVGVSVGGGGGGFVGWVPLAPMDPYYYPWQRPVRRTNVVYQNIYINNSVTVVNYHNFSNGAVNRIPVGRDIIRRAPVMGHSVVGITPGRGSLAPYPGVNLPPRAIPGKALRDRQFVVRSMPPPKPVSFDRKVMEIQKTGKPYAKPVAWDANVGKPFSPGMKVPAGVAAKTALGPEAGAKMPNLRATQGQEARPPKQVQRDVVRPTGKLEAPKKNKSVQPQAQPVTGQPETPKKNKNIQPQAQPGSVQPETPKKNKNIQPQAQPGSFQPETPKKNKSVQPQAQPVTVQPETPKKNKSVQPQSQPGSVQPETPKKNKNVQPQSQPGSFQPETPKKNKSVQPQAQPVTGQPETPKKNKNIQPQAQPGSVQPETPKKNKNVQPQAKPVKGQPEAPKKNKNVQPPNQDGSSKHEKLKKGDGAEPAPKAPTAPAPGEEDKAK